jgi:hypothetical protein
MNVVWRSTPTGVTKDRSEAFEDLLKQLEAQVRAYYEVETLHSNPGESIPIAPPELQYLWSLEAFRCLPWPGGMEQQPHITMRCMNICHNTRSEIEKIAEINRRLEERDNESRHRS